MNLSTLILLLVVIAAVAIVVRVIIRDKKAGRSSCGGDCSRCRGCH